MFSKLISALFSFEQEVKHDVEAIISTFTDTIAKLEAAAEAKLVEAEGHTLASIHYEQLADTAHLASEKARAVAGKIKDLVS